MGIKDEVKKIEADAKTVESVVEAWFKKNIEGTAIEANSELFNIAHAAKEELKKLLSGGDTAPATPAPAPAPAPAPSPAASS